MLIDEWDKIQTQMKE